MLRVLWSCWSGWGSSSGDYLCKPLVECGRSCAAWWSSCLEAVGTFIWNTLARLLGLANIIAIGVLLLYTILEPMMPSGPGAAPKTVELCVDYQGGWFPFRWDRANVGAGPCFALGVAFVGGGEATACRELVDFLPVFVGKGLEAKLGLWF